MRKRRRTRHRRRFEEWEKGPLGALSLCLGDSGNDLGTLGCDRVDGFRLRNVEGHNSADADGWVVFVNPRAATWIAWGMWLTGLAALAGSAVLALVNDPISTTQKPETPLEGALWLLSWVGFGLVGAIVVTRQPRNRIGWILCGITLQVGLSVFLPAYARYGLESTATDLPLASIAAWLGTWMFLVVTVLVVALVVLFPTGKTHTVLGRWALRAFMVLASVEAIAYALRPGPIEGDTPPNNPLGIPGTESFFDPIVEGLGTLLAFIAVLAAIDLVIRYRRSSGVERLQFRWFALAIAAFPILFLTAVVLEETLLGYEGVDPVVFVFALWGNGAAAAIGIAVTRHGLYEIDRLVSRTVSYAVVAVLLAGVFAAGIVGLQMLLPRSNDLAVAASTLVVAALFTPLRRRVQQVVDRRFNRRRYDAEHVVEGFTAKLHEVVDLETFDSDLEALVIQAMEPAVVSVWLKDQPSR